ncbi:maleylpyruvate isomerase family mycothiol-dependent enzyme [Streptomyces sp. NBC_00249]|uniref:maleylpyruvate isomerase family mycothiol-dependent enzyme n=1 Tax=Streptomyces sp. NBC_00249 TaxID=2975690 RepID=UPI00224F32D1|nr:maleylpyruvate isomerase family mycothiol-dependent enzyme [Streptomyces sp. NBC_00249]MCX5193951.1 maleylpyruvate isomerase family mycothiol-dependent enzyme [Streptomyces sp. NBC_00249]
MSRTPTTDTARATAAERRELADLLDALAPAQWDAPSLCAGWTVREVAAHMSLGFRTSLPGFAAELLKARGSLHRMTDRTARRDAAAFTPAELAALLRDHAHHPWKPPAAGPTAGLAHDVVHGLDITVALGHPRRVPEDRLRPLLAAAVEPSGLRFFRVDLSGIRLVADGLDWSHGSGSPVHGPAQDLLLVLCGRRLPAGRLHGGPEGSRVPPTLVA